MALAGLLHSPDDDSEDVLAATGTFTFTYPSKPSISSLRRCSLHPRQVATAVPPAGRISTDGYTHLYLNYLLRQAEYFFLTPLRPRQVATGRVRVAARARAASVIGLLTAGHRPLAGASPPAASRQRANRRHSLLPIPRGYVGIYTRREGRVNI